MKSNWQNIINLKIMRAAKYFFFPICLFLATGIFAQIAPAIQWQKCLGGTGDDLAYSIQQTSDGGYIVAGSSSSNNGDITGHHDYGIVVDRNGISHYVTGLDYWVVKLSSSGTIEWQKCLGGRGYDEAYSIRQTRDGGYIVAGETNSTDGDVTGTHPGRLDYWVVKLNNTGSIEWQKTLGGIEDEEARSIQQTNDGGFIVAGWADSNDGDVSGNHVGTPDYWVVKLSSTGTIEWQKCLGGNGGDQPYDIQQTSDSGYIVAGATNSSDGDVIGYHPLPNGSNAKVDAWIVKLNSSGNIEWQNCMGGSDVDIAQSIQQTTDGGYIVAGTSSSTDGDAAGNSPDTEYWVVKLNNSGIIQWQKKIGGTNNDPGSSPNQAAQSIQQTSDGGYIVTGWSNTNGGDVTGNHGGYDYWAVKLNGTGTIEWQKSLGGSGDEFPFAIHQTVDGGYILAGQSNSHDNDVSGNHDGTNAVRDFWVVKLSPDAVLPLRLISFTGILENNSTKLNWKTTNEINTKDFIVEKSADAVSFSTTGKVNAQTSSAIIHSYIYSDNTLSPGSNYYRLKMEDLDGRFTYSKVVRINNNDRYEIIIAPNPALTDATISFNLRQKQKARISIYDIAGRLVKILADAELQAGTHKLSWDAKDNKGNNVAAGIYILRVSTKGYDVTKKIVFEK